MFIINCQIRHLEDKLRFYFIQRKLMLLMFSKQLFKKPCRFLYMSLHILLIKNWSNKILKRKGFEDANKIEDIQGDSRFSKCLFFKKIICRLLKVDFKKSFALLVIIVLGWYNKFWNVC